MGEDDSPIPKVELPPEEPPPAAPTPPDPAAAKVPSVSDKVPKASDEAKPPESQVDVDHYIVSCVLPPPAQDSAQNQVDKAASIESFIKSTRKTCSNLADKIEKEDAKLQQRMQILSHIPVDDIQRLQEESDEWVDNLMDISRSTLESQNERLLLMEKLESNVNELLDLTPPEIWDKIESAVDNKGLDEVPDVGEKQKAERRAINESLLGIDSMPVMKGAHGEGQPGAVPLSSDTGFGVVGEMRETGIKNRKPASHTGSSSASSGDSRHVRQNLLDKVENISPESIDFVDKFEQVSLPSKGVSILKEKARAVMGKTAGMYMLSSNYERHHEHFNQLRETLGDSSAMEKTISVRVILVIVFAISIFVGMGAVSVTCYTAASDTIYEVLEEHMLKELSARIREEVNRYMAGTEIAVNLLYNDFDGGLANYDMIQNQHSYMEGEPNPLDWRIRSILLSQKFPMLFVGLEDKSFISGTWEDDYTQAVMKTTWNYETPDYDFENYCAVSYKADHYLYRDWTKYSHVSNCSTYDVTSRPWYKTAKDMQRMWWAPVYVGATSKTLMITLTKPLLEDVSGSDNKTFEGAIGIDVSLADITTFLMETNNPNATTFIIDNTLEAHLVASSSAENVSYQYQDRSKRMEGDNPEITTKSIIFAVNEIKDQELLSGYTNDTNSTFQPFHGNLQERNNLYLAAEAIADDHGLNWVQATVMPQDAFISPLLSALRMTIILMILISVLAVLVVAASVKWMSQNAQLRTGSASGRKTRLCLLLMFTLLLTISVSSIWSLWYLVSRDTANEIIRKDLMPEIILRIQRDIKTRTDDALEITKGFLPLLEEKLVPIDHVTFDQAEANDYDMDMIFYSYAHQYTGMGFMYLGTEEGHFIGAKRRDDNVLLIGYRGAASDGAYTQYLTDAETMRRDVSQEPVSINTAYDPRMRPWYQSYEGKNHLPYWESVYVGASTGLLLTTLAAEIIDNHTNVTLGVLAFDVPLDSIDKFLGSVNLGDTGKIFLIDRQPLRQDDVSMYGLDERYYLVGSSNNNTKPSYTGIVDGAPKELRTTINWVESDGTISDTDATSQDIDLRSIVNYLGPRGFQDIDEENEFESAIMSESGEVFVSIRSITDEAGLNWLLMVVIPRSDFLASLDRSNNLSLLLGACILFVAVIFVNLATFKITGKGTLKSDSKKDDEAIARHLKAHEDMVRGLGERDRKNIALLYVDDAKKGREYRLHRADRLYSRLYRLVYNKYYRMMLDAFILIHSFSVPWEPPSSRSEKNTLVDPSYYRLVMGLGLVAVTVYIVDLVLHAFLLRKKFFSNIHLLLLTVITACMLIDITLILSDVTTLQVSRPFRLLLVVLQSQRLRRLAILLASTIPSLFDVIILLCVTMCLMAITGVMLFSGMYKYAGDELVQENFDNFHSAALSLYVLLSADNYPDVMFPSLENNNAPAIYFGFWVIIGLIGFISLIVVKFNTAYKLHRQKESYRERIRQRKCLVSAFNLLDVDGSRSIDRPEFNFLFQGQKISPAEVEKKFAEVDVDGSGYIDLFEFLELCDALLIRYKVKHEYPKHSLSILCRSLVTSSTFRVIVLFAAVLHIGTLSLYGTVDNDFVVDFFCIIFFVWYVIELCLKICAFGVRTFWADSSFNKFDFSVITISILGYILSVMVLDAGERAWRFFFVLPAIRIISLVERTKKLVATIFSIIPQFSNIMAIFMVISYYYVILGMELFAEKFEKLADSEQELANLNFNDFGAGVRVLVSLFSAAGWNDIMWAAMVTTNTFAAIYFISYQFICMLMLNLFVGLVIDAFSVELGREKDMKEEETARREAERLKRESETDGSMTNIAEEAKKSTEDGKDDKKANKDIPTSPLQLKAAAAGDFADEKKFANAGADANAGLTKAP